MTRILAHRGYTQNGLAENSIPAFKRAIELGADGFEFDVHATKDRKVVVYHDVTLEKLGVSKAISNMPLQAVKDLTLQDNVAIPTLDEVLEQFGNKVFLNIEIKDESASELVVEKIENYSIELNRDNIIVSSFLEKVLVDVQEANPEIPTGLLTLFPWQAIKKANQLQCVAIHPFFDKPPAFWQRPLLYYSQHVIKKSKSKGLNVNLWTVNHEKFINKALKLAVDGIITDEILTAINIRNSLK